MRTCLFSVLLCFALGGNQLNADLFKNIDPPGSFVTQVTGISGDKVVGFFRNSTGNGVHGFLYENSVYTQLDAPWATLTTVTGVSGKNIVGYYNDSQDNGRTHGYVYDGNTYNILKFPGASDTLPLAVSGANVVGYYYSNLGRVNAFLFDGTNYT